mmetsp:Transcript_58271/g.112445  ORF Transcript_58271/g.112445 Transcript_58271/m.112445 type:complete len:221 (+) Transcript_58271:813-1475(+)
MVASAPGLVLPLIHKSATLPSAPLCLWLTPWTTQTVLPSTWTMKVEPKSRTRTFDGRFSGKPASLGATQRASLPDPDSPTMHSREVPPARNKQPGIQFPPKPSSTSMPPAWPSTEIGVNSNESSNSLAVLSPRTSNAPRSTLRVLTINERTAGGLPSMRSKPSSRKSSRKASSMRVRQLLFRLCLFSMPHAVFFCCRGASCKFGRSRDFRSTLPCAASCS